MRSYWERQTWRSSDENGLHRSQALWVRPLLLLVTGLSLSVLIWLLGLASRTYATALDHFYLGQFAWLTVAHTLRIVARILPIVPVVVSLLYFLIRVANSRPTTGFGEKQLWDWMDLLIVPIVLTIGGLYFGGVQAGNQAAVEAQRAEDAAPEAYFEQMGKLVLDENLSECGVDEDVRALARAQTSTVLGRVETDRKGNVIEFLYGAHLIDKNCPIPIVSLAGTNLLDVRLSAASHSVWDRVPLNCMPADVLVL